MIGCSSPGYFQPVTAANPGDAVLYIYRPRADNPGAQPLRRSYPDMILDGKSIGVLEFKQYKTVFLKPGQHTLTATGLTREANWRPVDKNLNFRVEPGETKYIKLDIQYNMKDMRVVQSGAEYLIYLTPMNADTAIYEIRDTKPE
jgi:hypothetical protein